MIDFDDIWLKCSKDSRTEFACFGFRLGLLFDQLFIFQTGHRKYRDSQQQQSAIYAMQPQIM